MLQLEAMRDCDDLQARCACQLRHMQADMLHDALRGRTRFIGEEQGQRTCGLMMRVTSNEDVPFFE